MRDVLVAVLLGAGSGLSIAVAGSPTELVALAFLGPALLLVAIERDDRAPVAPRLALLAGTACGFACNAATMPWIVGMLREFAGIPTPAGVVLASLLWLAQSLPFAIAAWLAAALMSRRVPGWIALAMSLAIGGSIAPMLFPWRLGVSQMPGVVFVQLAELGGPPLLDLVLALGSCAAMHALRRRDARVAMVAVIAIAVPYGYGAMRLSEVRAQRDAARLVRVGVVQPNIGIRDKHVPMLREPHLRLHREMTRALEAQGADVVLWPESSFPYELDRAAARDALASHRRILDDGVRGPVVFGALTRGDDGRGESRRFNSVVALERDGRFVGVYDKVHLLAFGEYVPLWDFLPPLQRMIPRGFTEGGGERTVPIDGARIGVLNCYEDLLVEHARRTAALDPSFLANFTNDAWFGDTAAPHLHHMLARLRAVETRRDLVRAVNTGISSHVLATGEDTQRTQPFEQTAFIADVRALDGTKTPWVRFGDWLTPILLGAFAAIGLARRRAR